MLGIRSIHHIALQVRDLARAEAFYHGVLELPVARRLTDPQGVPRSVWLTLGNNGLLMLERGDTAQAPGGWHLVAFAIAPTERATLEAALQARGVAIVGRSDHTLYIRDPEGNRLGLSHWPDPG